MTLVFPHLNVYPRVRHALSMKKKSWYRVIRVLEDSYAYHAPPVATPIAPILTPVASVLPNMATLNARLVNLRMFRIIVIVRAVDIADSRLTPRTHKYCVNTL